MNHCNKLLLIGFLIESSFFSSFSYKALSATKGHSSLDQKTTWAGMQSLAAHLILSLLAAGLPLRFSPHAQGLDPLTHKYLQGWQLCSLLRYLIPQLITPHGEKDLTPMQYVCQIQIKHNLKSEYKQTANLQQDPGKNSLPKIMGSDHNYYQSQAAYFLGNANVTSSLNHL